MNNVYVPGTCNIGAAEIKYRRMAGLVGLGATFILLALFVAFDIIPVLRLVIFLPATLAAIGFLQAQLHFCVKFGMSGLFNFNDDMTRQETVEKAEYRRKDQQKAVTIIVASVVIGIAVTVFSLYI